MHQGATGRYMIGLHVSVTPLVDMVVVTEFVSANLSADHLCVSSLRALLFSLE